VKKEDYIPRPSAPMNNKQPPIFLFHLEKKLGEPLSKRAMFRPAFNARPEFLQTKLVHLRDFVASLGDKEKDMSGEEIVDQFLSAYSKGQSG
jgi:hypothetical protein